MNTSTTISTRAMVMSNVTEMSAMLARMVAVRSSMTVSLMPRGMVASSRGSTVRMRSTVLMTLAPASLVMLSRIAGCWPDQAARRLLATPSITVATSERRVTAASRVLSTRPR